MGENYFHPNFLKRVYFFIIHINIDMEFNKK